MRGGLPVTGGIGLVVVLVIAALTGVNPLSLLGGGGGTGEAPPADDPARDFVSAVLGSTEERGSLFSASGQTYRVHRSCSAATPRRVVAPASSAMGRSIVRDQTVYIDLFI